MDITSILGLSVALTAILAGQHLEGGQWTSLINLPAALIVFGGTLGALLLETPGRVWREALKMLSWLISPPELNFAQQVDKVRNWCIVARRDGLIGLERLMMAEKDPISNRALELLIDGVDPSALRIVLNNELDQLEQTAERACKVFENAGGYSPTLGILGAVLGLIHVMENLTDPTRLGSGIAVAFVATVYGVALANIVLLPTAGRLKKYVERQTSYSMMTIEGAVAIALGEGPRMVEIKLNSFVQASQ